MYLRQERANRQSVCVPNWFSAALGESPRWGVAAFVALPVVVGALVLVGVLGAEWLLFTGVGWGGSVVAVWLNRTGRL
jgi:hypothetical protein